MTIVEVTGRERIKVSFHLETHKMKIFALVLNEWKCGERNCVCTHMNVSHLLCGERPLILLDFFGNFLWKTQKPLTCLNPNPQIFWFDSNFLLFYTGICTPRSLQNSTYFIKWFIKYFGYIIMLSATNMLLLSAHILLCLNQCYSPTKLGKKIWKKSTCSNLWEFTCLAQCRSQSFSPSWVSPTPWNIR